MLAAAANSGENPSIPPATHPNVAPILNAGTISPPRYPARIVSAVSNIFHKKSSGLASPFSIALAINPLPAPI